MVLYFSGTGNSRHVAEHIAQTTEDVLVSLNDAIKHDRREPFISKEKPFVFVCPTYGWRIPRVMETYLRSNRFQGSQTVYFVMTCGSDSGHAIAYIQTLCREKGWTLQGFAEVVMPENYVALFPVPSPAEAAEIMARAEPAIAQIAEDIHAGNALSCKTNVSLADRMKSGIVNSCFYSMFVSAKGFYETEKCTHCGKCAKLCPLNNITMQEGTPHWGENCTHCMACICGCPREAIEYKKNSLGRYRYYLPAASTHRKN